MTVLVVLGCAALSGVTGLSVYLYLGRYWDDYRLLRGSNDEH
jgi:membrane protein DedA with SNARE-associated domain